MAFVASDDGGVVVKQSSHESVCNGDLLAVEHHYADVLDRYGGSPLWFVVMLFESHYQLPVLHRQVGRVGEAEGSLDHNNLVFANMNNLSNMIYSYLHYAF